MAILKPSEKSRTGWFLLGGTLLLFFIITIFSPAKGKTIALTTCSLIEKIIPIFGLIFLLMFLTALFLKKTFLKKYLSKESNPWIAWIITIGGGILSSGPIYMWYPLLAQLKQQGTSIRYLAGFLYARAIKLPLLPLLIYYFGITYTIILTGVMILFSLIDGYLVELMGEE